MECVPFGVAAVPNVQLPVRTILLANANGAAAAITATVTAIAASVAASAVGGTAVRLRRGPALPAQRIWQHFRWNASEFCTVAEQWQQRQQVDRHGGRLRQRWHKLLNGSQHGGLQRNGGIAGRHVVS